MQLREAVGTALGEFVEHPLGHIVRPLTTGVSSFWTDNALRMATHPETWMLIYTYHPRTDRNAIQGAKNARALAIGTARRITNHKINALKDLRTDKMHFVADVYTEDNQTFCVYAKYTSTTNG